MPVFLPRPSGRSYSYHPREADPYTRQRVREDADRDYLARQARIDQITAMLRARPTSAVLDPLLVESRNPAFGPLPLPRAAGGAAGEVAGRYPRLGYKEAWDAFLKGQPLPGELGDLDKLLWQSALGQEEGYQKATWQSELAEQEAEIARQQADLEQRHALEELDVKGSQQRDYAQSMMDLEGLQQAGEVAGGYQDFQDTLDEAQLEAITQGIQSGKFYYTPEQKTEMKAIDGAISRLLVDRDFDATSRAKGLAMLYQQKRALMLNPMERPPDEQQISLQEDFEKNTLKDEYGQRWVKGKDGWMVARGSKVPERDDTEAVDLHTKTVMDRTGLDAKSLQTARQNVEQKYRDAILDLMTTQKVESKPVKNAETGETTNEWVKTAPYTKAEAEALLAPMFDAQRQYYGMADWAIDRMLPDEAKRRTTEGMDPESGYYPWQPGDPVPFNKVPAEVHDRYRQPRPPAAPPAPAIPPGQLPPPPAWNPMQGLYAPEAMSGQAAPPRPSPSDAGGVYVPRPAPATSSPAAPPVPLPPEPAPVEPYDYGPPARVPAGFNEFQGSAPASKADWDKVWGKPKAKPQAPTEAPEVRLKRARAYWAVPLQQRNLAWADAFVDFLQADPDMADDPELQKLVADAKRILRNAR